MKIELKCTCGASAVFVDSNGTYINPGGHSDEKGRVFIIEVRAEEWLNRHQKCIDNFVN